MMNDTEFKKNIVAFLQLLGRYRDEGASIYNAMAPGYDQFSKEWDAFARPALDYLLTQSAARIDKNGRILDAGCGTGSRIPDILDHFQPSELVALDISESMLDFARRKRHSNSVSFIHGNLYSLPFDDNSFDAVLATWAVETTTNPGQAVREFLRVIKPEGIVAYSFVQIPSNPDELEESVGSHLNSKLRGDLREVLSSEYLPFHDCGHSDLRTFADGMVSTVILRKCCEVEPQFIPNPFAE